MDEMDSMPSFDAPGKTKMSTEGLSAKATQSSTLKQREKEAVEKRAAAVLSRVDETRQMVTSLLERQTSEGEERGDNDSEADMPDDTDYDDDEALAAWRVRELGRLQRDQARAQQATEDKAERERRRVMTDKERLEEDRAAGVGVFDAKAREQRTSMSRYYHKGAFYMDEDSLREEGDVRRRASQIAAAATGEDKFDKSSLPSVMQVRKFGMKGRSKHTTLRSEDTTAGQRDYLPPPPPPLQHQHQYKHQYKQQRRPKSGSDDEK